MKRRPDADIEAEANSAASAVPPGFLKVSDPLQQWLDRQLGYFGDDRYVFFYYEPRGEEVMWNDGRGYGFGNGAWQTFFDQVAPVASRHGVNVGAGEVPGEHALVVDRLCRQAYFADLTSAKAWVSGQHSRLP